MNAEQLEEHIFFAKIRVVLSFRRWQATMNRLGIGAQVPRTYAKHAWELKRLESLRAPGAKV